MKVYLAYLVSTGACGALLGCGGASDGSNNATGDDGGGAAPSARDDAAAPEAAPQPDHGAPSSTYPAFVPDVGQIVDSGGLVMKQPVIVPITWNSDGSQSTFDAFSDAIGASDFWSKAVSEYGVLAATSGASNHVHIATTAPPTVSDSDMQTMVASNAGKTWPAATDQTIYAFFLPPGTTLTTAQGDACSTGQGGYHQQVGVAGTTTTVTSYAVVPSCVFLPGKTAEEQTTISMSHELAEAATDPHPNDSRGYVGFDPKHFAFDYFQQFQSEIGDACELFSEAFYQNVESSFTYWVQRQWSNKSASAGHHPCAPTPSDPYFNVTPLDLVDVGVDESQLGGSSTATTLGVHIPVGRAGTFQVGFFSDAPTGGPWTIRAVSGSGVRQDQGGSSSSVSATIDKTSGLNGEKAFVTVKVAMAGSLRTELLTIVSSMNGQNHYMPILIGSE